MKFQCEECGCIEYADIEGFGEDGQGMFVAYVCENCRHATRVYNNE